MVLVVWARCEKDVGGVVQARPEPLGDVRCVLAFRVARLMGLGVRG